MNFAGEARRLCEEDILNAAAELLCHVAAVRAVAEVESSGGGFLADGRPKILFEAHVFGQRTNHVYDDSHPGISSRKWDRSLYGPSGAHQYTRLLEAIALSESAALASASWGMFQIMGFNFELCGFRSLHTFVEAMVRSEGDHLRAFLRFITRRGLAVALRSHDWAAFAEGYNGPGYRENRYDEKLATAFARHAEGVPWMSLLDVQVALNRCGATPRLDEDGVIGPGTRAGLRSFQRAHGLPATGQPDPATIAALHALHA
jgi:hypothetical protein